MTRIVSVTVLVILAAASRVADAQTVAGATFPSGATLVFEHLQIYNGSTSNNGFSNDITSGTTDQLHFFNLATCRCAQLLSGTATVGIGTFRYTVRENMISHLTVPVDFWAGTSCNDSTRRPGGSQVSCKQLPPELTGTLDGDFYPGGKATPFNLYDAINAQDATPGPDLKTIVDCTPSDSVGSSVWALSHSTTSTDLPYDVGVSQPIGKLSTDTSTTVSGTDTKPPPPLSSVIARGGDGAIHLSWAALSATTDVFSFQALCADVDGNPIRSSASGADYVTVKSVCGNNSNLVDAPPSAIGTSSGDNETAVDPPSGDFGDLNPRYICGSTTSPTATSLDIGGLENNKPYQVILVVSDRNGNYQAVSFTSTVTPVASTDFWEDLHDPKNNLQGGLCLLAKTYGDDSPLTGALRAFRDDTLAGSRVGRWLTRAYYATGGKLGGAVQGSLALRVIAGILLGPLVVFALLWHWVTLPGMLAMLGLAWWLRRHGRAVARHFARIVRAAWPARLVGLTAHAAVALVMLAASSARAGGHEAYWDTNDTDDQANQSLADSVHDVTWHVGIRVGPYVPDIDKQFSGRTPGPYAQMFGGYHILPMLDVDRMLWSGFGQVGVGISLGYMQKTASAFAVGDDGKTDYSHRAADRNAFRLIPTALTATYRFTWFDDEYGVPLVPYVRGGLSYYIWWITVDNGDFAKVCKDGGMEPVCSQNKAYGASLGVEGAIGLSIRAERIDASAAQSMRQSGIQHAGIYGEISAAKVDGFGSDKKLSVGATTWFAGVEFEF